MGSPPDNPGLLHRRALLRLLATLPALPALSAAGCHGSSTPPGPPAPPPFLTDAEQRALGALADVVIPPDDQPGGSALGAVSFIERALTAFDVSPPAIFAGGPYSGRAPFPAADGSPSTSFPPNEFQSFVPLDRYADAAWRLTIFGSSGVTGGGPNDKALGPIVGWRDQIRNGLAAAAQAAGQPLETLDPKALASLYKTLDKGFTDLIFTLVTQGAYSAPEYGGNPGLAGWKMVHFEGDVMPYGYSQYDPMTQMYKERTDAPVSTANPGADPEPPTADTWAYVGMIVNLLGGTQFP